MGATAPIGLGLPQYRRFRITLRYTTSCRTPLDEWSAQRRDFYLTKHNTHNRQASMPLAGFEPEIPASERLQTHTLNGAVTGTGTDSLLYSTFLFKYKETFFKRNYNTKLKLSSKLYFQLFISIYIVEM
jgi:hypothetical protein